MTVPSDVGSALAPYAQCGQTPRDPRQQRVAGMAFNFSAVACPPQTCQLSTPRPPRAAGAAAVSRAPLARAS